ncbi:hypothetical protein GCM10010123_09270 [Pilimelia anulata]|uniref:Sensor-like histidine kinase SenX3 n=1 Tax=Pilimelia anulata TaxID=53371 RepID=A0A8J3B7V7_9ACTN|nr:HAMP domain-containing sensor histidine kinase [Pilimelia anulata]GGJ81625.1 hypothetical protein GCM10010123_09270 [Pilimelia anulata]
MATGDNGEQVAVASLGEVPAADLQRSVDIPVAQQQWTLRTTASSTRMPGGGRSLAVGAIVAGSAIAALLALLAFMLLTARARALKRVADATAELQTHERAAREQANLLAVIMDSLSEAVVVVDRTGKLLHYNSAAASLTTTGAGSGDTPWLADQPARRPDGSLFAPDDLPWTLAARDGTAVDGEEMTIGPSGAASGPVLSVSARPLHGRSARRGAVVVLRDITARKQYEAQIALATALLEQELEQRKRTEAKLLEQTDELNAFAGVVAHDLQAPLASVAGYAELLLEDISSSPDGTEPRDGRSSARSILNGVDRMQRLIHDLLSYATARDAPLHPETVNLRAMVEDVISERTAHLHAGAITEAAHSVPTISAHENLDDVRADRAMLRQLLDNLVGNALKYTAPDRPAHVEITTPSTTEDLVEVVIADRGIGIPADQRARVFDSFHRAHRSGRYRGTGLGLAICQRIIQKHGGRIFVDENPGGGSRFHFTLPAAAPPRPGRAR